VVEIANPQKENGYTSIANEILEQIAKIKLSPTQYRIIFIVWRYTYGFNRKEHELSLSFLSTATGCDKRQLQRELKSLEEKKVIDQVIKSGAYRKVSFNKNYEEWVGETTIGEIDIGEIDNGEIINTTIGEIVNTTVGEIDNQEINNLNKNLKKDIYILSQQEQELITVLEAVKKYPLDREKEIDMYKRLQDRYPTLNIIAVVKEWTISKLDKPLKAKDSPRSQINTWCSNAIEWGKNLKEKEGVKGGNNRDTTENKKPSDLSERFTYKGTGEEISTEGLF
jgi:phage replication O-like protein O